MTFKYVTWLSLIVGCSSQAQDQTEDTIRYADAGPYAIVPESDFRNERSRAQVDVLDRCCERIGMKTTFEVSEGMPLTAADSGAHYDIAAASACIAQLSALSCRPAKQPAPQIAACREVYRGGQLRLGEVCALDWDCAQPAGVRVACSAAFESGSAVRRCQAAIEPAAEGDPCAPGDAASLRCDPPLICSDAEICVMPKLGDPCVVGAQYADTCPVGLVCDRSRTQRCIEPLPVGSACEVLEDCEDLACRDGVCLEPVFGVETCTAR